jgi:DNA-binding transcriptional regulator of glucitol operon
VLFVFLTVIFVFASALLWWQLSRAQATNAELLAELNKVRGRLRALRQ